MKREIIAGIFVSIVTAIFIYLFTRREQTDSAGGAGVGMGGSTTGMGGIGGAGGSGGVGGTATFSSLAELAAAVDRLAAGVQVPIFYTVAGEASATTEIRAGELGKQIKVLAYAVTTASGSSDDVQFWSATSKLLWAMKITPAAGTSGANLATEWPGYLFATNQGEALRLVIDSACTYSVTYWLE